MQGSTEGVSHHRSIRWKPCSAGLFAQMVALACYCSVGTVAFNFACTSFGILPGGSRCGPSASDTVILEPDSEFLVPGQRSCLFAFEVTVDRQFTRSDEALLIAQAEAAPSESTVPQCFDTGFVGPCSTCGPATISHFKESITSLRSSLLAMPEVSQHSFGAIQYHATIGFEAMYEDAGELFLNVHVVRCRLFSTGFYYDKNSIFPSTSESDANRIIVLSENGTILHVRDVACAAKVGN